MATLRPSSTALVMMSPGLSRAESPKVSSLDVVGSMVFGHNCDGTHDAVVASGGLRCRATTCVRASDVQEFAATVACGCLREELAAKPVADGVFVGVWWQHGAFGVVDVVDPLVVDLGGA